MINVMVIEAYAPLREMISAQIEESKDMSLAAAVPDEGAARGRLLASQNPVDACLMPTFLRNQHPYGLSCAWHIPLQFPHLKVVIHSIIESGAHIQEAIGRNIPGYLFTHELRDHLNPAIRQVAGGRRYRSPGVKACWKAYQLHGAQGDTQVPTLNRGELKTLQWMRRGRSVMEISLLTGWEEKRVDMYWRSIRGKFGTDDLETILKKTEKSAG